MTTTIHIGPREYRVAKRRDSMGTWDLAFWCDCAAGPHWHPLDRFARKADAFAAAESHAIKEQTR
jgi:hypothetical protein